MGPCKVKVKSLKKKKKSSASFFLLYDKKQKANTTFKIFFSKTKFFFLRAWKRYSYFCLSKKRKFGFLFSFPSPSFQQENKKKRKTTHFFSPPPLEKKKKKAKILFGHIIQ